VNWRTSTGGCRKGKARLNAGGESKSEGKRLAEKTRIANPQNGGVLHGEGKRNGAKKSGAEKRGMHHCTTVEGS